MDKPTDPIQAAIDAAGSQTALAAALGIKAPSVSEWKARGKIPAERVLDVERLTGVSRHDLRPDVFGPAPTADESAADPAAA